jgi:hypothetical protein
MFKPAATASPVSLAPPPASSAGASDVVDDPLLGVDLLLNNRCGVPVGGPPPASVEEDGGGERLDVEEEDDGPVEEEDDVEEDVEEEYARPPPRVVEMETTAEIIAKKQDLLYEFNRLEKRGCPIPRRFTLASSLHEMQAELDRIKRDREVDNSIKLQRRVLMSVVSGVEWLNGTFDPVGAKLEGWSDAVYEQINDYDPVFEELHIKYQSKASMPPEAKLLCMVMGSGFMHHMTSSMFKTQTPALGDVLKSNPDLARNLAAATSQHMAQQIRSAGDLFGSVLGGAFAQGFGAAAPAEPEPTASRPVLRGPRTTDVDDLLKDFERFDAARPVSAGARSTASSGRSRNSSPARPPSVSGSDLADLMMAVDTRGGPSPVRGGKRKAAGKAALDLEML